MEQLSKKIVSKKKKAVKILQFGEGNFLRAFVDWIIQTMNDKGIYDGHVAVVQPMPFGRVKDLEKQDGLFTLYLQGIENNETVRTHQVIDVLDDFIDPFTEYQKYLGYAESKDLEVVISNTTEAGISLDPNDIDFEKTPTSFPGKLLALLYKRYQFFKGDKNKGLVIIACELIDNNADELQKVMVELAKIKGYDEAFIAWLKEANTYVSTLVDRIVPGYPRDEIEAITNELQYIDNSIVKGEVFHLWVLKKDARAMKIFPCHEAGLNVIYADSIKPYKERKVKVLNGAHTLLVPVSYLYGIDTVKESIEEHSVGRFVKEFIFNEALPTIELPHDQMISFANSVLERFLNPFVRHELMSIALNSISKYRARVLPTVKDYLRKSKQLPQNALFSLAALIKFYQGKRGDEVIALKDDQAVLDFFKDVWANYEKDRDLTKLVKETLSQDSMWGEDLNQIPGLSEIVLENLTAIVEKGMKQALTDFLGE